MTTAISARTRILWNDMISVPATPETIFPLLCPVREYDWLPHWSCRMIHSRSGVAEDGCIFDTNFPPDGKMTWVVSVYEPPKRIEFSCIVPELFVMRLKIRLERDGADKTIAHWYREFLSLSDAGDLHLEQHKNESHRKELNERLERHLREYLIERQ